MRFEFLFLLGGEESAEGSFRPPEWCHLTATGSFHSAELLLQRCFGSEAVPFQAFMRGKRISSWFL